MIAVAWLAGYLAGLRDMQSMGGKAGGRGRKRKPAAKRKVAA